MDEAEGFVGLMSLVATWLTVRHLLLPAVTLSRLVAPPWRRAAAVGLFLAAMGIVLGGLTTVSASDVRSDDFYIAYFALMGWAWLGGVIFLKDRLGLSMRDDVLERRNTAALVAFGGVLVGHALAFTGGNIGEGPGWWCVVAASGLASLSLFGVWLLMHGIARVPDLLTVERDLGAGVRTAGLFVACGAVFGRAAAGDWLSLGDTIVSFVAVAWPALGIVAVAGIVERALAPSRSMPGRLPLSLLAAGSYLTAGAAMVARVGWLP
ncbi:MAG: hypothetical protein KF729_07830 [Sandaracinaceae bacterium]|nr:hypothetical protein [Sandaracinaceae bacterium]